MLCDVCGLLSVHPLCLVRGPSLQVPLTTCRNKACISSAQAELLDWCTRRVCGRVFRMRIDIFVLVGSPLLTPKRKGQDSAFRAECSSTLMSDDHRRWRQPPAPRKPSSCLYRICRRLWVSLPAPRVPVLDFLLPRHPILRQSVLRVPQRLHPQAEEVVWVQAYDLDGKLVHDIKTKHPRLYFITAVAESGGTVWLGIMGSLW